MVLIGFFICIELAVWGMGMLEWMSFRMAGYLQLLILLLAGVILYKKQILAYWKFAT